MKENLELQIEQYLGGKMTPEQVLAFENKMYLDEALYNEVLFTEDINLFLKNRSSKNSLSQVKEGNTKVLSTEEKEIRDRISRAHKAYTANERTNNRKSRIIYFTTSIAAILVIFVSIYFFTTSKSNMDLYYDYYNQNDLPSFTSRSTEENRLSQVEERFKDGDFNMALKTLDRYINTSKEVDPLCYIYKGMIYSEKGEFSKAIEQLEILRGSNSLDLGKVLWFEALVNLKFDKRAEAKQLLRDIAQSKSNYKYFEAVELLEEL